MAGIAAARGGARTLIVEKDSHLGGTAAFGIPFLGIVSGQAPQGPGRKRAKEAVTVTGTVFVRPN